MLFGSAVALRGLSVPLSKYSYLTQTALVGLAGSRLVELDGTLACPAPGTGAFSQFLARAVDSAAGRDPFADGRSLGTRARPERITAGVRGGGRSRIASPA